MKFIKNLLNSLRLDNGDDDDDDEFSNFEAIVTASKYADSNSSIEHVEKLLDLIGIQRSVFSNDSEHKNQSVDDATKDTCNGGNAVSIASIICRDGDELLPGQPAYQPTMFGKVGGNNFKLRKFDIPRKIYDCVSSNNFEQLKLTSQMSMDNYVRRFQDLLWIEEAQQAIEMRKYDMYDVMLAKFEDFYLLEIPGLAEGRPSLLRGDRLILRSDSRSSYYEGYIHEVREKDILFKLHEYLHITAMDGLRFTIQFLSSRTPFRRCHHGVLQYHENRIIPKITFPVRVDKFKSNLMQVEDLDENNFPTFNSQLNLFQKRAIINILKARSRPTPYIIFGPPGTGKTVTLVEAVLQAYARNPNTKILVCANSNSSADLCARRIQSSEVVPRKQMIRVSAFYRMEKLIPPDLVEITREMDMIDADTYSICRLIVTTCIQAGSLYEFYDRFDYVFIDEAGHACEPEALIPIGLLRENGCCVLAGDPHQLGPICISRVAQQNGLGTSLLERLSRRSVYQRNALRNNRMDYDENYITKLRICYRCDSRVLAINNKLFYDNDLKFVNETPKLWLNIMQVDHPLIFHSVKGRDRREFSNPSWFNPAESIRCLVYAKRLYDAGLKPEQLGIITPYRRQIDKLNLLFESCQLTKCKIATMEEFQGDEREIIIISTVRTKEKRLDFDKKYQLGFLFDPKRFNVALSRAKWLVIVVGDPQILQRDIYWTKYMESAVVFEDCPST